jgi:DNA-binding MarR family transcriptional regulator
MVAENVPPVPPPLSPLADSPTLELLTTHLPDVLVDTLDRAFRRLRKSMLRPPAGQVPVPALGRPLDMAKIFACDAVAELAETSRTVSVKDVAATLDLEHSTVSRLLGEVEDDGLIVRGVDAADRRRTTIELTDLGRAVVADATAMSRFFTRVLLAEWSAQDVQDLSRLISRLADTVHDRLDALPDLAMTEFCRARADDPATPPRERHR